MRVSQNQTNSFLASQTTGQNRKKTAFICTPIMTTEKTFVWKERSTVKMETMINNITLRNTGVQRRLSLMQVHTDTHARTTEQDGVRENEAKTKTNTQGLWPLTALSAVVFILSSLLSVWLYELFMEQECVATTVQLLMKQSFRAPRLGNHRHNVAGEYT